MPKKELIYVGDGLVSRLNNSYTYTAEDLKQAKEYVDLCFKEINTILQHDPLDKSRKIARWCKSILY